MAFIPDDNPSPDASEVAIYDISWSIEQQAIWNVQY